MDDTLGPTDGRSPPTKIPAEPGKVAPEPKGKAFLTLGQPLKGIIGPDWSNPHSRPQSAAKSCRSAR